MHCNLLVLGILMIMACFARAQEPGGLDADKKRKLDSLCRQDITPGSPGLVMGIVRDGKVIYQRAEGMSDLETGTTIGPGTRFNLASNGKQFTALAILVLARQGRLSEDQDIREFLPTVFPRLAERINIRHLLTHTSGIRDVYDIWSLQGITWWERTYTNADALLLLEKQQALNFNPGTAYLYSNSNYILLAQIISKASGKSFRAFTDSIFKALGMPHTGFETDHRQIQGPIARPYFNFSTWTSYPWIWDVAGDGNLFSTLDDQLRWETILQDSGGSGFPRNLIRACQALPPGQDSGRYGYGIEFGHYRDFPYRYHEGATGAWKASILRFPEQRFAVFTATNSGKVVPSMYARQVADVLLGFAAVSPSRQKQPIPNREYYTMEDLSGTYLNPDGFYFRFEKRDTSLFLVRYGRNDTRLIRESGNIFHQWNDPAFRQEFKKETDGSQTVTAYHTSHDPYTLTKPSVDWTGVNTKWLQGAFENDETGVRIRITLLGDRRYQLIRGIDTSQALLVSPELLLADPYQFSWESHQQQPVREIFLQSERMRGVRFIRVASER
jgi:CubicO group peptidase (beta-lactamase class C family)